MHTKILKFFLPAMLLAACTSTPDSKVVSPDGAVKVDFRIAAKGTPSYSIVYKADTIVRPSTLGFRLLDDSPLAEQFEIVGVEKSRHNSKWAPVWGENDTIADHYNAMTVKLQQRKSGFLMNVEFRVYNDGVGFRYVFPEQSTDSLYIAEELTQFAMAGDHTAWWIPGDYDTQEYEYTESRLSQIRGKNNSNQPGNVSATGFSPTGVQTSLLMRDDKDHYINIHEAALVDYPAMHLDLN
ncbi:MAG: glycoside hydrolase family 97 N-terminal domain-containing protein, partial [Muribaculaceae bacterium]|nr:glycoside hydrolase family 97 N-terminal domain-containing protein [Muribaculaceae bacterium]